MSKKYEITCFHSVIFMAYFQEYTRKVDVLCHPSECRQLHASPTDATKVSHS